MKNKKAKKEREREREREREKKKNAQRRRGGEKRALTWIIDDFESYKSTKNSGWKLSEM